MKLSAFVAAAAVFGTSFIAVNPVGAESGWKYMVSTKAGHDWYIRNLNCGGPYCSFEKYSEGASSDVYSELEMNCRDWTFRWRPLNASDIPTLRAKMMAENDGWLHEFRIMSPSSAYSGIAKKVCS